MKTNSSDVLSTDLVGEMVGVDILQIEAADCPNILPVNILKTSFNKIHREIFRARHNVSLAYRRNKTGFLC